MEQGMNIRSARKQFIGLGLAAALGLGVIGSGGVLAQDDPTETPEGTVITHPAHVHMGTCAELDPNPAYPLNNVGPRTDDDGNPPDPDEIMGSLSSNPVEVSETEIEVNLDDILMEAHAINVHLSDQEVTTYIACGDLGGPVLDDKLYIGLSEQNDSGYYGIAILEKDDDNTKVTIYLAQTSDTAAATPEA
jgi:hypothetical protein